MKAARFALAGVAALVLCACAGTGPSEDDAAFTFNPPATGPGQAVESLCPANSVLLTITNSSSDPMTLVSATVNGETVTTGNDVCDLAASVPAGGENIAGLGDISLDNSGGSGMDLVWSVPAASGGTGEVHTHIGAWTAGDPVPSATTTLSTNLADTDTAAYQAMLQGAANMLNAFKQVNQQVWAAVSLDDLAGAAPSGSQSSNKK